MEISWRHRAIRSKNVAQMGHVMRPGNERTTTWWSTSMKPPNGMIIASQLDPVIQHDRVGAIVAWTELWNEMGYRCSGAHCSACDRWCGCRNKTIRSIFFISPIVLRCGMQVAPPLWRKLPVLEGVTGCCYVSAHFDFRHVRKSLAMLKCGINTHFNAIQVITFRSMHLMFCVANRKWMWISPRRPRKFIWNAISVEKSTKLQRGTACTHN